MIIEVNKCNNGGLAEKMPTAHSLNSDLQFFFSLLDVSYFPVRLNSEATHTLNRQVLTLPQYRVINLRDVVVPPFKTAL